MAKRETDRAVRLTSSDLKSFAYCIDDWNHLIAFGLKSNPTSTHDGSETLTAFCTEQVMPRTRESLEAEIEGKTAYLCGVELDRVLCSSEE